MHVHLYVIGEALGDVHRPPLWCDAMRARGDAGPLLHSPLAATLKTYASAEAPYKPEHVSPMAIYLSGSSLPLLAEPFVATEAGLSSESLGFPPPPGLNSKPLGPPPVLTTTWHHASWHEISLHVMHIAPSGREGCGTPGSAPR